MNAQRRLLFVDHVNRILGGAEINLLELLEFSSLRDHFNVFVATATDSPLANALKPLGIPTVPHGFDDRANQYRVVGQAFSPFNALRAWKSLRVSKCKLLDSLRSIQPHAVVSCTNKDHFVAGWASHQLDIPSLWWINDLLSPDFFSTPVLKAFRFQANRFASTAIAVSEAVRKQLIDIGVNPHRTRTIHNGIPLDKYPFGRSKSLKTHLNLPARCKLIGNVGRFTPWKGQAFFLELAEACIPRHPDWHFLVVGQAFNEDADFEIRLKRQVQDLDSGQIHFLPFQTNIAECLSGLDVFVHTSLKPEPFGRIVIESMAVGTPVLAARAGGVSEIMDHGRSGWLCEPGKLSDYRNGLEQLLLNPALSDSLAIGAKHRVSDLFSMNRLQDEWMELLNTLTP